MTEHNLPPEAGRDHIDAAADDAEDYDPDADQDTEPTNMAPAGDRPNEPPAASSS